MSDNQYESLRMFSARHLKPAEFAKSAGVPKNTVYAWVNTRQVDSVKLGRHVFIPISELARIVAEGTRPRDV